MTKRQYLRIVENELANLNERIDKRILSGLGYDSEARRHKRLLGLTRELKRKSFFDRLLGRASHQYVR
jgi:hypothetical protein